MSTFATVAVPKSAEREVPTTLPDHWNDKTTIWADGEVWREDRFGRVKRMPDAMPVRREVRP